jgi:hypothetical protein
MMARDGRGVLLPMVPSAADLGPACATGPYPVPVKVKDPSGQSWRVSRRWVPWRRRLKGAVDAMPDMPMLNGLGDDPISAIVAVVALVLLAPFILVVLVAGVELLLVLLVLPFAILGRVLLGRHWTIEVRRGWRPWWEGQVGDWQAAGLRIHEVADAIRGGQLPPQTLGDRARTTPDPAH